MSKKFAMIGASGYIAPRHMRAIKETGHELVAVLDPNDSIGVIDQYFPKAKYFSEPERFDRHLDRLKRRDKAVDYVSICSPNYLHDSHIRMALRNGAQAICEKPLVLQPEHLDALETIEAETGQKINCILQLRLHPKIIELKKKIDASEGRHKVQLTYITPRGQWYHRSWKGDMDKSGGIATNIGVHFFDMLIWLFGKPLESKVRYHENDKAAGTLMLPKADVTWKLSVDPEDVPYDEWKPFRAIIIDGEEAMNFSDGFTDLHNISYKEILKGNGFGLQDVKPALDLVYEIRNHNNQWEKRK